MPDLTRPLLIAITDRHQFQLPPRDWASESIAGGVDLIQIREKDLTESDLLEFASEISEGANKNVEDVSSSVARGRNPGTQAQINNAPNIARLLNLGLHLPESEPIPVKAPHPLSHSIHSLESAQQSTNFDFLIAGHIFATPSKSSLEPRGLDWLSSIVSNIALPIVAIGGINSANAVACIEHGASGIAVITAIAGSSDPRSAAAELRAIIDETWDQKTWLKEPQR